MALTDTTKKKTRAALHKAYSAEEILIPWVKADVDAAITGLDDFLDTNAATINSALPQPFRGSASTADKAVLMATVIMVRYLVDNPSLAAVMSTITSEIQRATEV